LLERDNRDVTGVSFQLCNWVSVLSDVTNCFDEKHRYKHWCFTPRYVQTRLIVYGVMHRCMSHRCISHRCISHLCMSPVSTQQNNSFQLLWVICQYVLSFSSLL
jgi:hypothetical protein